MKYLEVDSRRRISLGDLATCNRYLVVKDDDGSIHLIPTVVMTVAEFEAILTEGKRSEV